MILALSCSCLSPIHWSQVLSREWRCSWSCADRRCSNFIWVINKVIVYSGVSVWWTHKRHSIVYLKNLTALGDKRLYEGNSIIKLCLKGNVKMTKVFLITLLLLAIASHFSGRATWMQRFGCPSRNNFFFFVNSSPPGQNDRNFTDNIFRCIFVGEKSLILIKISPKFVPKGPLTQHWFR